MSRILAVSLFALVFVVGCQVTPPAAAPAAAPTIVTERTATSVPPTNAPPTKTAAPTAMATATGLPPSPTSASTTEPTGEPAPGVGREMLIGTWWQFDSQAQGNNFITFREDGTFGGRHGPDRQSAIPVTEGTFTLEGNQLTITDNTDCPEGEMYEIKFTTQDHLFFKVLGSTCENFADDFKRQPNWDRLK